MSHVLGLDLGPNSIGWALIDDSKEQIIDCGVRIFEEGLNRSGGKEESKNATRRSARQARRTNARQKSRLRRLSYILIENDMMPDNPDSKGYFNLNPYQCRADGVNKQISLFQFGRALYHINQRRGFKSNRKTEKASETGVLFSGKDGKTGIDETSQAIHDGGYKTLGEYLNSLNPHEKRQRNRYTLRAMYIREFNKLWDTQEKYYPDVFKGELKKDLYDAIFFQRKLKSQKHTIRHCTFEPKKRVSPKSAPIFQEFRIYEQLSRIRVSFENRENDLLTEEERQTLFDELSYKNTMSFDQVHKILSFPEESHINLQNQEKLKGNTTNSKLFKVFGKSKWAEFSDLTKWNIWHTLHIYNDPPENENWLNDHGKNVWGLNEGQIEILHKIALEASYANLSHKAMTNILPYLKKRLTDDGKPMTYDKAVELAGYSFTDQQKHDGSLSRLPLPDNLRNPIVQQSLYEVRHVINAIVEKYGNPDTIRVELARDTKNPKWRRNGLLKLNRKIEGENDEIREKLIEQGVKRPSREDIIKYRLWEECNKTCPFTGRRISFSALFNESSNEFQIEHIIPYSRSLDDSQANKTLCHWKTNQIKHNKTPFEAFGHDEELWEEILDRVSKFKPTFTIVRVNNERGDVKLKWRNKLRKFKIKNIDEILSDEFIARQLVDTAYISKEVSKYLTHICPKVYVSSGRTTSTLRYLWGLNVILSGEIDQKQREDHRHHAVDAIVVANTTHGYVQTMSRYHKYDRDPSRSKFPYPWKTFWDDVDKSVNNILVSHRIKDRPRGQLHEETNYGRIVLPNGEMSFVVRKNLNDLTPKQISQIVDPTTKQMIISHLQKMGVDVNGSFKVPKEAFDSPLNLPGNPYPIRKVRVAVPTKRMLQLYKDKKQFVEYGKNHHIEIFVDKNNTRSFRVVPLYDAVQRNKTGKPVVNTIPPDPENQFFMSLSINELVLIDVNESDVNWNNPPSNAALGTQLYRIQKMDINGTIQFCHHTVSIADYGVGKLKKTFNSFNGIKVTCDELGNIQPV